MYPPLERWSIFPHWFWLEECYFIITRTTGISDNYLKEVITTQSQSKKNLKAIILLKFFAQKKKKATGAIADVYQSVTCLSVINPVTVHLQHSIRERSWNTRIYFFVFSCREWRWRGSSRSRITSFSLSRGTGWFTGFQVIDFFIKINSPLP